MSATLSCTPYCGSTVVVTNVPGTPGANGVNSFTNTTASFVIPDPDENVTVQVVNSTWMVVGQTVVTGGPAHFKVISLPNSTSAVLQFLDYEGDAEGTVVSGVQVGPSGTQPAGGGGGSGQVLAGALNPPVDAPPDPASPALYYVLPGGPTLYWDTVNLVWS